MSIKVIDYIPESSRELPLYSKVADLLQLLSNAPFEFYTALEVFYDAAETEDVDILSKMLGADHVFQFLTLTDLEKRRFLAVVKALWSSKGTDRGILFALSIFGVKARIAKWYQPDVYLGSCEIEIELDVRQNPVGEDIIKIIEKLIFLFASTCLRLVNIGYSFRITSTVPEIESFVIHEDDIELTSCIHYDSAAVWKINPNLWVIGQDTSPENPLVIGEWIPEPYKKEVIYILPEDLCWQITVGPNYSVGMEHTYTSGCINIDPYCELLDKAVKGTLDMWFVNEEPCVWYVGETNLAVGEEPPRPLRAYECCCNDSELFSQIKIIIEEN